MHVVFPPLIDLPLLVGLALVAVAGAGFTVPFGMLGAMPAWAERLSEDEIWHVINFLRDLQEEGAEPARVGHRHHRAKPPQWEGVDAIAQRRRTQVRLAR